jgi:hypothetical protein
MVTDWPEGQPGLLPGARRLFELALALQKRTFAMAPSHWGPVEGYASGQLSKWRTVEEGRQSGEMPALRRDTIDAARARFRADLWAHLSMIIDRRVCAANSERAGAAR